MIVLVVLRSTLLCMFLCMLLHITNNVDVNINIISFKQQLFQKIHYEKIFITNRISKYLSRIGKKYKNVS